MSKGQEEQSIQAVVLTDNYQDCFEPISSEVPQVLMPLAGIPIIEYTLQWLQMNGIKEIYIVYSKNHKQLSQYFAQNHTEKNKKINVHLYYSAKSTNMGSLMKDFYEQGKIEKNFLLVKGTLISNMPIKAKIADFQKKFKKDNMNIMATCLRTVRSDDKILTAGDDFAYVVNHDQQKLIQVENLNECDQFNLNLQRISVKQGQSKNFRIHVDLYDPEIYICSLDVLKGLSERGEDNSIKDMIKFMLTSEINEESILVYLHENTEYSALIKDPRTYKQVTQDIINGYSQPLSIELLQIQQKFDLIRQDFNCYISQSVKVSRGCKISNQCVIGAQTSINQNTYIKQSIIGRKVEIGKNVHINNCVIWDNVKIADGCVLDSVLIGNNCEINQNTRIQRGVQIGPNSIIKSSSIIKEGLKICSKSILDTLETNEEKEMYEEDVLKERAFLGSETYEFVIETKNHLQTHLHQFIGFEPKYLQDKLIDEKDWDDSESEEEETEEEIKARKEKQWKSQIEVIMKETLENPVNVGLEVSEMVDVKMQYFEENINIEWTDMVKEISKHLWNSLLPFKDEPAKIKDQQIKKLLNDWAQLFIRLGPSSEEYMTLEWISQYEMFCLENKEFMPHFKLIITELYQSDEEQKNTKPFLGKHILTWAEEREDSDDPVYAEFYNQTKNFINFIKQDFDSDSNSGSESGSGSDGDDVSGSGSGSDSDEDNNNDAKSSSSGSSGSNSKKSDSNSDSDSDNDKKKQNSSSSESDSD